MPTMSYHNLGRAPIALRTIMDADAIAFFERLTTPVTDRQELSFSKMVSHSKEAGVWPKLDVVQGYFLPSAQAARQNWKGNFANATAVGGPVHTPLQGYAGNGSSSYLNSNYNSGDGGAWQYQLNNAAYGYWTATTDAGSNTVGGVRTSGGSNQCVPLLETDGRWRPRINQDTQGTSTGDTGSTVAHFGSRRTGSNSISALRNGAVFFNANTLSTGIPNLPWFTGAANTGGSPSSFTSRGIRLFWAGAGLTNTEWADWHDILTTLMTDFGVSL